MTLYHSQQALLLSFMANSWSCQLRRDDLHDDVCATGLIGSYAALYGFRGEQKEGERGREDWEEGKGWREGDREGEGEGWRERDREGEREGEGEGWSRGGGTLSQHFVMHVIPPLGMEGRDSEGGRKYRGNGGSEEEEQGDVCEGREREGEGKCDHHTLGSDAHLQHAQSAVLNTITVAILVFITILLPRT